MDVLVLSSTKNLTLTGRLRDGLSEIGVTMSVFEATVGWSALGSESLFRQLRASSHTLFVVDSSDLDHPAFLLAAGFCYSRGARALVWDAAPETLSGYWAEVSPLAKDFETLMKLVVIEQQRWNAEMERDQAREQLVGRGFEVTNSAYWETVEKGDTGSVELFLKAGFAADSANKKGVTMLCLSVRFSHFAVLRLLLSRGADINRKSLDRDNTPLMDAAAEGHVEMVQELVALGADLAGQSRNGQNALVLAIGKGSDAVAKVLLNSGADPFADDKLGMNALKYAQLFGRKDVLELIGELHPGRA